MERLLGKTFFQLPIAPKSNSRIRFLPITLEKEKHLLPHEALALFKMGKDKDQIADGVMLYGPGDPLVSLDATLETIRLIREIDDKTIIGIRTLGIYGEKYADKLMQAGVSRVEVIMEGVTETTLEKIYAWIRPGFKTLKLKEAAQILLKEQAKAIPAFKGAGMYVEVITTCYPENNSENMSIISKTAAKYGADAMSVVPYVANKDADINLKEVDDEMMDKISAQIAKNITLKKQICLFDATQLKSSTAQAGLGPSKQRPNVAVVSSNGIDIDMHLGHAERIIVYGPRNDGLNCLLEARTAPSKGGGESRWHKLANLLTDCFVLLAADAGSNPRRTLAAHNIPVQICDGQINDYVDSYYSPPKKRKRKLNF